MSLREIELKRAYSSDIDDMVAQFYVPVLERSSEYLRVAGFFSSSSLAVTARGIMGLLRNGGVMKLIVSPLLRKADIDAIVASSGELEKACEETMIEELDRFQEVCISDHVAALGWLVANGRLEIRVAVALDETGKWLNYDEVQQSGIFHQKVGVLFDSNGDMVSFSGSINETASGWLSNIEEFKVFRSWDSTENAYVGEDLAKFWRFWNNEANRVVVIKIPDAVMRRLIQVAPSTLESIDLEKWYKQPAKRIVLSSYQNEAIRCWIANEARGIFEMATGTGKTFTALGCLEQAAKNAERLFTVIVCPYQHLVQQWKREIDRYGIKYERLIVADSSGGNWKKELTDALLDMSMGYRSAVILIATNATFCLGSFRQIVQKHKNGTPMLLIADEVHSLGAINSRRALWDGTELRLGLSATPSRWFDVSGTQKLMSYFHGIVYQFTLEDAINNINPLTGETYLVPYRYNPHFVSLTPEELTEYVRKSQTIMKLMFGAKNDEEREKYFETLLFQRANIVKNAEAKYDVLREIFNSYLRRSQWTIVYCSPQQIERIVGLLNRQKVVSHRFTMEEGTSPRDEYGGRSERDYLLEKFAQGKYQALVAMKCLDEGVDIPPARNTVLMANSGNPREYIQRIGRVIRRCPGKREAQVFDIVVTPSYSNLPEEWRAIELRMFRKELSRCEEIAQIAINNSEALKLISDVKARFLGR
jgi:superfamily II DNA or RNA helicase